MPSPTNIQKSAGGSIFQKLPRLSTSVWLIIILALFLVVTVPLAFSYFDETSKQETLTTTLAQLQSQYNAAQSRLTAQAAVNAEISRLQKDITATGLLYKDACDSIETSKDLLDLAWKWDITITNIGAAASTTTLVNTTYPVTIYTLTMNGQVAAFQNYLLELGTVLPSAQITDYIVQPSQVEGGLDSALLTITVFCNR